MRVLMVSDVYYPRINGVSTSIENFRRKLTSCNIEVLLVAPRYENEIHEHGITRVTSRKVPGSPEDRLSNWKELKNAVFDAAQHCDLIHIQTPFMAHYAGINAARKLNIPVISTYHTLFEEYFHHYIPFLPRKILKNLTQYYSRLQCNALDAIIVPSTAMQTRLLEYAVSTPIHVLPTGISLSSFDSVDGKHFRLKYAISKDRPIALFVGRVAREKNIDFLLEAIHYTLAKCPDTLLIIAGDGPAMSDLKSTARSGGLQNAVKFIGYQDHKHELPGCYAAANVFVFASRTETQGLVLLEAMAAGLPVIAFSEMGTEDILKHKRGCLIPPYDAEKFGNEIAGVLNSREMQQQLSDAAKDYARTWSDDITSKHLATLYKSLITA
ncbi:MAG TPA: glycosyltransferase family 4 protein [Gammaproteobacteria bacterium]|nr:glycosyltransferase family 4 protein [Gammaproteobacteria bacterium]